MKTKYRDLPTEEIIEMMKDMIDKGFQCFIKWTCENCGERVTSNTPNVFFTQGYLHEDCSHVSFPEKFGLMVMTKIQSKVGKK